MLKLLVVEDVDLVYQYIERILTNLLPKERLEITRAATLRDSLELIREPWDVILMDYAMGDSATLEDAVIRTGADLVQLRRSIENTGDGLGGTAPAFIIGTSSATIHNEALVKQGADTSLRKDEVPEMAAEIRRRLPSE